MKETFIVTQVTVETIETVKKTRVHEFVSLNPNGTAEPPTFDTYKEAEDWIKTKGAKNKFHQIQKYLIPTSNELQPS